MAKKKAVNPAGGAPTKYRPEMPEQAEKLCRLGATDAEMADFFGVVESTLNEWKLLHPEFSESIKRGKIESDANVAHSLYSRAMGSADYPPDTTACIFWLKNRRPSSWRDKTSTEHSGSIAMTHEQALAELDGPDDAEGTTHATPASG